MEMNREQMRLALDEASASVDAQAEVCAEISQRYHAIDKESQAARKLLLALTDKHAHLDRILKLQNEIDKAKEHPDADSTHPEV